MTVKAELPVLSIEHKLHRLHQQQQHLHHDQHHNYHVQHLLNHHHQTTLLQQHTIETNNLHNMQAQNRQDHHMHHLHHHDQQHLIQARNRIMAQRISASIAQTNHTQPFHIANRILTSKYATTTAIAARSASSVTSSSSTLVRTSTAHTRPSTQTSTLPPLTSSQRAQIRYFLLAAFAYILSPIDLVPEVIFGVFGIFDDLLFLFMCLFCVAIIIVYPIFVEMRRKVLYKVGFRSKPRMTNNKKI